MKKIAIALVLVVAIAALLLWFALPAYVARRAIAEARERGIALEIGRVAVGIGSITLERIHAVDIADSKDPAGASVIVDATEVSVTLRALAPKELVVRSPVLTLPRGEASLRTLVAIRARLSKPVPGAPASQPAAPTKGPSLERIVVQDGTATLSGFTPGPAAAGMRVLVRALAGELTREPSEGPMALPGSALLLRGEAVVLTDERPTFGPWSITLRRAVGIDEQTLELRPTIPGAATLRRESAGTPEGTSRLRVVIKKQRIEDLGLPGSSLTAVVPATTLLDVDVDHEASGSSIRGHAKLDLSSFTMPAAPAAAPLRVDLAYDGPPAAARIREGTFSFGPFRGSLTGTLDVGSPSPKAHLELTSTKTPCDTLARSAAEQALPGVGAALSALGLESATKRLVTGQMGFVANIDVDAASPTPPRFVVRPVGGCSVEIPLFSGAR